MVMKKKRKSEAKGPMIPIQKEELDALRNSLKCGAVFDIPIDNPENEQEYFMDQCTVEAIYSHMVVFRRKNGLRFSMTINELAVLKRKSMNP